MNVVLVAYDPKPDAEILHHAFKGVGTDQKAIISVMAFRPKHQLVILGETYHQLGHKHTLAENFASETSGHFQAILQHLITPKEAIIKHYLKKAVVGAGTDETLLINVLLSVTNEEFHHCIKSDPAMVHAILGDVSGDFKRLIAEVLKGERDQGCEFTEADCEATATVLYKAGEGKLGTDETIFIEIMSKKSPEYLQCVSEKYRQKHKHTLEQAIVSETSYNFQKLLVGLTKPRYVFIADAIHHAVHGAGTDDATLVFFFSWLQKPELYEIATIYQVRHKKSLLEAIKGDTSGHYRDLLVALLT